MSPELIAAVKERIELGYSHDKIREELKSVGYDDVTLEQALAQAMAGSEHSVSEVPKPPVASDEVLSQPVSNADLPGVGSLFSNSISFVFSRLDLLFILAGPLALMAILGVMFQDTMLLGGPGMMIIGLGNLIAVLIYLFAWVGALRIVTNRSEEMSLGDGIAWARKNVLGFIWVNLLMFCVVYGGFILFIVPGIILSILLFFTQYVYASEGIRGVSALLRSRDLVKGKWWSVFLKLFLVGLLFMLIFVALAAVGGIFGFVAGGSSADMVVMSVLYQFFSTAISLCFLHVGAEIYESLRAARPAAVAKENEVGRTKYIILACLGLLFPFLLIPIILASLNDAREMGMDASLKMSMSNSRSQAEIHYFDNNQSYEGACDFVRPLVSSSELIECNDSKESWALIAKSATGDILCVDNDSRIHSGTLASNKTECALNDGYSNSDLRTPEVQNVDTKARAAELRAEEDFMELLEEMEREGYDMEMEGSVDTAQ